MCKPNKRVLGVSIVTYNTSIEEVREILRILKDVPEIAQITIIDNSDQLALLRNSIDITRDETKVDFFKNDKNVGYVAHNIGMNKSIKNDLDYHLVINSDLIFDGKIVSKLLKVMEKNKNIGLIMPKILNYDGTDQHLAKRLPRPHELLLRLVKLRLPWLHKIEEPSYTKVPKIVPYLSGCFMLLRVNVLREVGLMDPRFFMYAEDIDLSRRIAAHSLNIYYPELEIFHKHGAISKRNIRILMIHMKNIILYFNKWGWIYDQERRKLNNLTESEIVLK